MITGEYGEAGYPYVEGRIIIPRLDVNEGISFLVDTGAHATCIHPRDAKATRIPFHSLRNKIYSHGIGGRSPYFQESALISFRDGDLTRIYNTLLLIAEPNEHNQSIPSLLGLNIINHWDLCLYPAENKLEGTVRRADRTEPTGR